MAKVFLSYDRDDTERARPVALALEKAGHSVWWDLHIRGGEQYTKVIDEALKAADAVVVLWSQNSVESAWVRDEAAAGRDTGRLVPASLDDTVPPLGFRQYQTIALTHPRRDKANLELLLQAIEALALRSADRIPAPQTAVPVRGVVGAGINRRWIHASAAAILLLAGAFGWWSWKGRGELPVVEVAPADTSTRSRATASALFVKLGSLAQIGQGRWQLVDAGSAPNRPDLIFRTADTGTANEAKGNVVLLDGKGGSLLWSHEFSFPAGRDADLRQQMSLTTGRVLGCALEARQQVRLPADLLKSFLNACASLAELSGNDYGPVADQLRRIVDREPRFEAGWARLIMAESTAVSFAWHTDAALPLSRQLKSDAGRARSNFPNLPELAVADRRLRGKVDFGKDIQQLSAAAERAPDNPHLFSELSVAFLNVGRMQDAIGSARKAAELDPLSSGGTTTYVMTLAHGGQIETARNELAKAESLWAGTGALEDTQLAFHLRYGNPSVAKKIEPEGYNSGLYYEARTNPSPANISKLKAGIDEFRPKPVTADQVGWAIQALGEFGLVDDVYYWVARLPDAQVADISYILFRPALASVRKDLRFMPLARRAGLLDYWQRSGKWPDFCSEPNLPYDCKKEAAKLAA